MDATERERTVRELLRKMKHHDADERFMAVHDLVKELRRPLAEPPAADVQSAVRQAVVELLEDRSPDVSTMATKCLTVLVQRFDASQSVQIVERLGGLISGQADEPPAAGAAAQQQAAYGHRPGPSSPEDLRAARDTWADGLKTLVASMDAASGRSVAPRLAEKLVGGMAARRAEGKPDAALDMLTLSVLRDLLVRFGDGLAEQEDALLAELLPLLDHDDFFLRERAGACAGALAPSLSDENYARVADLVVGRVCEPLDGGSDPEVSQTYLQTVNLVARSAGLRVAPYLERLVPRLVALLATRGAAAAAGDDDGDSDATVLLWEQCLRTFESLISSCPQAVTGYLGAIKEAATGFIAYDPNLASDADEAAAPGDGGAGGDDAGWGDDGGDGDGWGDDADVDMAGWGDDDDGGAGGDGGDGAGAAAGGWGDDMVEGAAAGDLLEQSDDISWKVRRAAVGVIRAFVRSRGDALRDHYGEFMGLLLRRFSERETAVKLDVLLACRDLLRAAVVARKEVDSAHDRSLGVPVITRQRSSYDTLSGMVEAIVEAVRREFAGAAADVKRALYGVLRELLVVRGRGGSLAHHLDGLMPEVLAGVRSDSEGVKADALLLLHHVLEFHTPAQLASFVADAATAVAGSIESDRVPKSRGDALRILGAVAAKIEVGGEPAVVEAAFGTALAQLRVKDADESVKEGSLAAAAGILARHGAAVGAARAAECVAIMGDRVGNRATRVAALEALTAVARSDALGPECLGPVLAADRFEAVARYMRKKNVAARHASAVFMAAAVAKAAPRLDAAAADRAVAETLPHLEDSDLQLAELVLRLYAALAEHREGAAAALAGNADVTARVVRLATNPLVQGNVLASLIALLAALARAGGAAGVEGVRDALLASAGGTPPAALVAVARCVAAVSTPPGSPAADAAPVVLRFAAAASDGKAEAGPRLLALLTLGELGRTRDLASVAGFDGVAVCAGAFASTDDKAVRDAAALALGRLAVGGAAAFVPEIVRGAAAEPATGGRLMLFLGALRELLSAGAPGAEAHAADAVAALLAHANAADAGPRDAVAECLGRLAAVAPAAVVPELVRLAGAGEAARRCVGVAAVRHAVSPASRAALHGAVGTFVALAGDAERDVRREAVVTIAQAARLDITLVEDQLESAVLPALYEAARFDASQVEEIDYGAFKEKRDHGLPLRIAAYEALERVVAEAPHHVNVVEFVGHVSKGLTEDSCDVQLAAYRVLHFLAEEHPEKLLETLDSLPPRITKGVKPKLKEALAKNGQRAQQVLHAVVVTVLRIADIPGVQQCTAFCKFRRQVMATKQLKAIAAEIAAAGPGAAQ